MNDCLSHRLVWTHKKGATLKWDLFHLRGLFLGTDIIKDSKIIITILVLNLIYIITTNYNQIKLILDKTFTHFFTTNHNYYYIYIHTYIYHKHIY